MKRPTGIHGLVYCYFAHHQADGTRRVTANRVMFLGILPLLVSVALLVRLGLPRIDDLPLFTTVTAIITAVLIGLLPLMHSVIGQTDPDKKYTSGERPIAQQEIHRIETLQDLHATVSLAIALLVVALAIFVAFPFLATKSVSTNGVNVWTYDGFWYYPAMILTFGLYAIAVSTALTFFDIASGIFEAVENHAELLKERVNKNVAPPSTPDVTDL